MTDTHIAQRNQNLSGEPAQGRVGRLRKLLVEEARILIPAWAFFFLTFLLVRLTRMEIVREFHIRKFPPSRVLIGSIVVAKGVLLVDLIPFVRKVEKYPLLGAACLKALAYFVIVFLFEYVDELVDFRHEGIADASRMFGRSLLSSDFWVVQAWLVLAVFAYSAIRELSRQLGPERFHELVFGRSSPP